VEWNGRYRDDVRRFWRGDDGMLGAFASRISGSSDIYAGAEGPARSINFVTCHDGFTLNDLVSFRDKHNEANAVGNRDGSNDNLSDNYGTEGETDDIEIESTRQRQIKNFLLTLLISRGVPMLAGGDEFRRTQHGNNNAYCQDNETSWYDWRYLQRHEEIHRFARGMIAFRRAHPMLSEERVYTDADIRWFDSELHLPDWNDRRAKRLACLILEGDGGALYFMFNASTQAAPFRMPPAPNGIQWRLAVDTGHGSPADLFRGEGPVIDSTQAFAMAPRSSAILLWRKSLASRTSAASTRFAVPKNTDEPSRAIHPRGETR
jgi:glycogen operon protein